MKIGNYLDKGIIFEIIILGVATLIFAGTKSKNESFWYNVILIGFGILIILILIIILISFKIKGKKFKKQISLITPSLPKSAPNFRR